MLSFSHQFVLETNILCMTLSTLTFKRALGTVNIPKSFAFLNIRVNKKHRRK
ncbi:hypothetical protein SRABI134_03980 [Peribacillus sp. Bi134]|nr:hypothetical protein SRABI134_03980 [Peribacillus sp. Bi134]